MMGSIAMSALASPITYNIIFPGGGFAPTSGSFTYDASAPLASRFTNFTVSWDGLLFDFTNTANTGETFFGTDCGTSPSSQSVFMFLSGQNVCVNAATIDWTGFAMTDTFISADSGARRFRSAIRRNRSLHQDWYTG